MILWHNVPNRLWLWWHGLGVRRGHGYMRMVDAEWTCSCGSRRTP